MIAQHSRREQYWEKTDFKTVLLHWYFVLIKILLEIWTYKRDIHMWETRYNKWTRQQNTHKVISPLVFHALSFKNQSPLVPLQTRFLPVLHLSPNYLFSFPDYYVQTAGLI